MSAEAKESANYVDYVIRHIVKGDCVSPFLLSGKANRPLRAYFQKDAEVAAEELITRTYVAVPESGEAKILGFISLMNAEVQIKGVYDIEGKPGANRYRFQPAIRIARLAVADDMRGVGIGSDLVALSMTVALDVVGAHVGCRFMIVDSKQESVPFYGRHGFTMLDTQENQESKHPLMFLDLKLYKARDNLPLGETIADQAPMVPEIAGA